MALRFELLCDLAGEAFSGAGLRGVQNGDLERGFGCCRVAFRAGKKPGEKAVEPSALGGREGRRFRDVGQILHAKRLLRTAGVVRSSGGG